LGTCRTAILLNDKVRLTEPWLPRHRRPGETSERTRVCVPLDCAATLRALVRRYLFVSIFRASAESLASENASRLAAMGRAEKNIDETLETLKSSFQRVRQAGIDEELFDVVAGFEALSASKKHRRENEGEPPK
jgi:ATP synthase F1 gamma subunit